MIDFSIIVVTLYFVYVFNSCMYIYIYVCICVYNAVHVWLYMMVGAWFYCMEVCYNIMYYFLHIVHVFFVVI